MVNQNVLAAKLGELADRVARVRSRCPRTAAELNADRDALDLVSFNLMLGVQCAADIASHFIADEGWPPASTLAEGFARMHEHGVLSLPSAEALSRAVGLRNVVAHGYAGLDVAMVHAAAISGMDDLDRFAREVSAWAQKSVKI